MALLRVTLALSGAAALLAAAAPAHATFPGRNGALAYASSGGSGGPGTVFGTRGLYATVRGRQSPKALAVCKLIDEVPDNCAVTQYQSPSYSPNGRRSVFDAGAQLAVIGADGSGLGLLSAVTADDGDPAFAPDGRRIVFSGANERGTTDVYVRRLDGGQARPIVLDASEPAWSSRNEIAYVRDCNVYRADPNGRHRRFVTSGIAPDWSPDGRRLVLIRPAPSLVVSAPIGRIYVVGARGRGLRAIGAAWDLADPVWSPDGRWLAFDGFELGVHTRRVRPPAHLREIAPTQYGSEGGFVVAFDPAWQPR